MLREIRRKAILGLSNGGNSHDLELFSRSFPAASLSSVIFMYSCAAVDKISTDIVAHLNFGGHQPYL